MKHAALRLLGLLVVTSCQRPGPAPVTPTQANQAPTAMAAPADAAALDAAPAPAPPDAAAPADASPADASAASRLPSCDALDHALEAAAVPRAVLSEPCAFPGGSTRSPELLTFGFPALSADGNTFVVTANTEAGMGNTIVQLRDARTSALRRTLPAVTRNESMALGSSYPDDAPPPELAAVRTRLTALGATLDALHAHALRPIVASQELEDEAHPDTYSLELGGWTVRSHGGRLTAQRTGTTAPALALTRPPLNRCSTAMLAAGILLAPDRLLLQVSYRGSSDTCVGGNEFWFVQRVPVLAGSAPAAAPDAGAAAPAH